MKQIKLLAVAIGLCVMLTACDGDNKGNSIERSFSACFLRVTDGGEASSFINTDASLRLFFDLDNNVAEVAVSNFQPSATSAKGTLNITGLPWGVSEAGSMVINQPTVASVPSVTNLKVDFMNRYVATSYGAMSSPVIRMSFTYEERYNVVLYQEQYLYLDDKTVVTTIEDGSTYSPEAGTQYVVTLNPAAMTATVLINGAKFAENMRAVQMVFKDIPMSFVTGGYSLQATSLIPESSGTPYPQYEITDLRGNADINSRFTFDYTCGGKYRVNTMLNYLLSKPSNTEK